MATNGKYVVEQNMPAQQRAMVIGDGNTAWDSFFDAYQAASLKGDQAVFEVYGGEYNTSNFPEINIKANDSLRITADLLENGYKTTPFTITDIDFVNNGTVTIKRSILADADTDKTVTFTLASTTEKKTTFKNNSSLTVENAAFSADKVVNGEDAEIVLKNATFTVPVVENAGLVRITGGEFAPTEFTGGGTVWIATTFNNSAITGDNDFIVKYAATLNDSSIKGDSLNVQLGNLTLNGGELAFNDVAIASGKYLLITGDGKIDFGSVTGTVSVKADAVLSDSTVSSGTVYFGKNTGLIGENAFDVIQVSGASKDATSDDYRKLTIGDDTAPTVDPETGDVTFATTLSATKIQLGSSTKYGNLDIKNASVDLETLNSANADNVVTVAGESDLTIGNLTGSINLANGAKVTADIEDAAEGAAFKVGYTTRDTFDPASGKPTPVANAWVTVTETVQSFADVATLAGVAEDVDVNVAGGTLNVLGTAVVADVATSVAPTTTTVTGTTYHYDNKKKEIVADRIEKTTSKAKNLTGTVNVGTKDGKTEAFLEADDITNGGVFNVYGSATLVTDDIANAGTLNFAKGSFIAVDDIEGDAENKTGTVSIASENAVISSITDQKSVSIASGANLTGVKAISENTAVTITAASVEVNELLDNGTVTIGKGASTLTVEEFAGTITMADGAILSDSEIGAANPESIEETENSIYVGSRSSKIANMQVEGHPKNVTSYDSNVATFAGDSIAAADLVIDSGIANVTGVLVVDDVETLANTDKKSTVTFVEDEEDPSGSDYAMKTKALVSTLNIAAASADDDAALVEAHDIINAGVINVGTKAGLGSLDAVDFTNNGTVTVAAGSFLDTESFTNTKTLTLNGDGDLDDVTNSGTVTVATTGFLDADDIENSGTFNVKGELEADKLTNKMVANKKFEVTGRADIADVDNAGLINVFGHLNVATYDDPDEDPVAVGTLTNIGTINVNGSSAFPGGVLNAGDIINGKFAEGEEGEDDYVPAVEGTINVGGIVAEEPLTYSKSALVADSITNYVGTISVEIGSYLDAGTITNYGTITVNPTEDGESFGKLFANTIVNAQGAVLELAGTLGSFDDPATEDINETQTMTIVNMRGDEEAEIEGGVVTFARVTNLQNVVLKNGEFAVATDKKAYFDQLSLMGGANLSITSLYLAENASEDAAITIDALSSITCGDETQYGVKSGTIIFDADAVLPLGSKVESHMVVDGYVADDVELYLKQNDELVLVEKEQSVAVTINGEDYALIRSSNGITLSTQSQKKVYVNQAWNSYKTGDEFTADIINSDGTVTENVKLIYGFNAFKEFNEITYSTYAAKMPPKVPYAQQVFLNASSYNPADEEGKKYFFFTSDQDVVFDVNPVPVAEFDPENPEYIYTVTLNGASGRTYLMKPVNYNKVQVGVEDEKPVYEYSVTDNDGNVIDSASPDFPTFTIAENLILNVGMLKVGDVLDDGTGDDCDWTEVAPAEGEEFPTFEPKRSGGVANLVVKGTHNGYFSVNPYSTSKVEKTGKVISTTISATKTEASYIRNAASVTVNGNFAAGEAAEETAVDAEKQFQMYRVAFADGGTLNLNNTRAEISVLRLYNPAGAILDGTTAVINISNSYVDTTTNDIEPSDTTRFFSLDAGTVQPIELNLTEGSVLNVKKDFNPLADTTVNVDASTLQVASLTNDGEISAENGAVIKNVTGGEFANNGTFALDASTLTVTEAWFINKGEFSAANGSDITGSIRNNGGLFVLADSTIGADAAMTFSNWAGIALIDSSVASFSSLSNDATFTVTGESSLSVANTFTGTVELVSATLTDSEIVAGGLLNIAANVPNDDPDADPEANEVTFAGGNVIAAKIENAGTANFSTTGDAVNAIDKLDNAEGATLAISGNLTKSGASNGYIKNLGTATATGATITSVELENQSSLTLNSTSVTNSGSYSVWNANGTLTIEKGSVVDAQILNSAAATGKVTVDGSTVKQSITNNKGTVEVKSSSKIASVTNKDTFSMTASDAVGDISNEKTFTANGGSITGNINNVANATFTMEKGAKFVGAVKNPDNSYTEYSITNNGTFNLSNAKITELRSNRSKGATIDNTNGTFIVSGSDFEITAKSITTASGDVKKFKVSGTGKLDVVTLSGRIRIDDDTTLNSAAIDNGADGELYVASSKTLTLKADSTFKNTLITTNAGTIKAEKALSTKLDDTHIGALDNKNNATVNVTGDMTVGTVTNDGTINASANVTTNAFTNNDGKTFNATGSGTVTVNGALSNSGAFNVTGNLATNGNAITNVKNNMTVGGTLKTTKQNAASGNVTITAGSITATGAMEVGDVANNGGTLTAKAGLKAGAVTNGDGKTIAVTGALNTSGKITNSGSLTADSVATNGKDIENVKNTFTVKGALNTTKQNAASGAVTVTSGKIDVINNGAATIGALTVGAVNGGSGTFNAASLNSGDVMVNRGTVSITGAATVGTLGIGDANSGTFTAASLKSNAITVTKGTVTITNAIRAKGIITNSGTISAGSVDSRGYAITNNAGATFTVTGDLTTKPDSGNNYGAVTNNGTFKVDGNVTTGAFTSDGGNFTINAKADKSVTMTVNGNFSNTGTLTIDVTAISGIAVGEQVQVVSVTGDVLTSVGNIALDGTDKLSFKKIIQTTGDKKGIYLYKTDEVVSAPTIYVNGAWNTKSAGDQIEFPEGSQTPLTFGLDAFAGTNTLDLASDTTTLNIVYSGGYDALNITQSLDVAIWNSTGTSPAAQSQVFAGLSVSGNKTVANFCGQKIMTTGATIIGAGNTLDLSSSPALDRDPSTLSTGAIAELKDVSGTGTIKTDWNSELTFVGACGTDFKLDVDVTGYNGGGKTFATGYSTEENYRLIVKDNAKFDKYFVVEGSALKMNAQARETIYVSSSSAYDIANAIDYTWGPNNEYHADNIVILGGNYAEVLSLKGIGGQTITVEAGNFTKSVYGGNVEEGTGTGRLNKSVTGDINIEVNGGSFKNLVAGDNIKTKAIYSRTGNINLSISGTASFTSVVAAGMMCQLDAGGSLIELVGNTNLTISGGSFAKTVFGGMFATKLNSSGNTYLDGTANVTVVGGDDKITFGDGLCVGSYGYGGISKGTALTLTGNAEMITFTGTGTDIWGGCSGDYYTTEGKYESSMDTGAKRTLTFSGFEGNFAGCDSINGFSDVFVKDATDVVLSKGINLKHVDNWTFECGSTLAGAFTNDLTKDTLTLKDYTNLKASETWTLFGADVDLQGVNAQMNVYFGETKVAYDTTAQGWVSGEYTLKYTEDDGLFLKNTAVLA